MAYIEVRTAQNIILRYELANVSDRITAFVIDILIVSLLGSIIGFTVRDQTLNYIFLVPLFFLYHLFFEILFNGQSPGKKFLKIRVIDLDGGYYTIQSAIIRWALRLIDIAISLSSIAILSILGSNKNQRLGDLLANTAVIKISRQNLVHLNTLESLNKLEHEVQYPGVLSLLESEILLIKEAIERYELKATPHSSKIISELSKKVASVLDVDITDKKRIVFLKEVLRDYVFLTR